MTINGKTEGIITFEQSERALLTEWDNLSDAKRDKRNTEAQAVTVKSFENARLVKKRFGALILRLFFVIFSVSVHKL